VDEKDTGPALDILTTVAAAAAGAAAFYMPGPGVAAAAAAAPGVVQLVFEHLSLRRVRIASSVVEDAAAAVQMTVEELVARLEQSDLHGELAAKVLIAAQDSGCEERLRALSRSLALGLTADDVAGVSRELLYVRALADLDSPHVLVLSLFLKSWEELGLSDYDTLPPDGLSLAELGTCTGLGVTLDPVMGVLLRNGLLEEIQVATLATSLHDDPPETRVRQTVFGSELLDRMQAIGEVDTSSPPHELIGPADAGGCLVCGGALTQKPMPSNPAARISAEEPGKVVYDHRPRMPLCDKHLEALVRGRLAVGWCEKCQGWGETRRLSPCGLSYDRYR
jgi:hypothetical protein